MQIACTIAPQLTHEHFPPRIHTLWVGCDFRWKSSKFGISVSEVLHRLHALCSPAHLAVSSAHAHFMKPTKVPVGPM